MCINLQHNDYGNKLKQQKYIYYVFGIKIINENDFIGRFKKIRLVHRKFIKLYLLIEF